MTPATHKTPLRPTPKRPSGRSATQASPPQRPAKSQTYDKPDRQADTSTRPGVIAAGIIIGILIIFLAMRFNASQKAAAPSSNLSDLAGKGSAATPKTAGQGEEPNLQSASAGTGPTPLNHTFTFEEVFDRLRAIDKDQSTDFRKESLRNNLPAIGSINIILPKVKAIRDDLNRSIINNETPYWIHLVEGRIDQLESEKKFQLAIAYGKGGLFSTRDINGSCARQKEILDAALLFNQSALHGGRAMSHFDIALTQQETWPILGINDERMAFFGGETRDIGGLAYNTVEAVRTQCLGLKHEDNSPSIMIKDPQAREPAKIGR